jgi:hypothetical protein
MKEIAQKEEYSDIYKYLTMINTEE